MKVCKASTESMTLQSLCVYPEMWAGYASQYGISDMQTLETVAQRFESHYIGGLLLKKGVGEEEKERVHEERNPLFHANQIRAPVLLLQGAEDKAVPREQASEMERVVRESGGKVRLIFLEGGLGGGRMLRGRLRRKDRGLRCYLRGCGGE